MSGRPKPTVSRVGDSQRRAGQNELTLGVGIGVGIAIGSEVSSSLTVIDSVRFRITISIAIPIPIPRILRSLSRTGTACRNGGAFQDRTAKGPGTRLE